MMVPSRSELTKAGAARSGTIWQSSALATLRDGFSTTGRRFMRRLRPLMVITPATDVNALALLKDLAHALLSVRGEASGVAIATDLLRLYEQSDEDQRRGFFAMLATDFGPDETILAAAWKRYCDDGPAALPALARSVEAPRQELFRRLNLAPGGTSALVRMRADLLVALDADASLAMVDADLSHLLQSWFNRGFLFLRSIDWSSPASLLERIIRYEAVHDIASWADLRNRLDPDDRRCYAFFHPAMPDEPLIFVEVGLTRDIPDDVRAMLDTERTPIARSEATTATFYSISNCQPGLRGISFGHFLIKQVAADLKRELPALSCFVTLSPLPGLIRWLRSTLEDQADVDLLARIVSGTALEGEEEPAARAFLLRHAVTYLTQAKNAAGKPRDPVARFHLGNGARLERLNWNADRSANGLRQSGGLMVNYLYDLARIEENHEAFAERSEIVTGAPFDRVAQSTMGSVDRART